MIITQIFTDLSKKNETATDFPAFHITAIRTLRRLVRIAGRMASGQERSIHEMLKDSPALNESSSAIHSGSTEPPVTPPFGLSSPNTFLHAHRQSQPPSTLHLEQQQNIGSPDASSIIMSPGSQNGSATSEFLKNGASKIDSIKHWSISTYKCTRQLMLEKLGKTTRTVDTELETQIEQLRDTQRKYLSILRLTRAMSTHFFHMVQTQHALSESFSDLAQKSPELQEEFLYNAETQRNLTKNGEILLNALNFFCSSVNTLCNQTIDDTLITIKQYEQARIEFDAYKMDLESTSSQPGSAAHTPVSQSDGRGSAAKLHEAQGEL